MRRNPKGSLVERWIRGPGSRLRELLFSEARDASGPTGWLIRVARVLYFAYRNSLRDFAWERAATLSFVTVASLIPLSVLFLSFVGGFWNDQELRGFVKNTLLFYLVPEAELREQLTERLTEPLHSDLFKFQPGVNLLAVVGLVVAGLALLVAAERVFNKVWDVSTSRTYLQKLRIFWIILTTSPVAIGASFYLEQWAKEGVILALRQNWLLDALYSFLLPGMVSFVAFTILNIFLPNTRVRLGPALAGALVTALLWEGAKKGFFLYVKEAKSFNRFYGVLWILPVFLLWIYVTWLIVLFGAEVTRASQNLSRFTRWIRGGRHAPPAASPFLAVYLLDRLYGAFERGLPLPALSEVALGIGVGVESLEGVAHRLVEDGVLVQDASAPGRFAPARSPVLVRLREVVEALAEGLLHEGDLEPYHDGEESGRRVLELFSGARKAFLLSLGDTTVADLILTQRKASN